MVSDLSALQYVLGCGTVCLIPIEKDLARKWMLTALNLLFVWLVLSSAGFTVIVTLIVSVHFLLKAVSLPTWRRWAALALGAATLGLFLLHKLPYEQGAPGRLQGLLAT